MDSRSFPGGNYTSLDASFQINPGLCADQSQLNDFELDLDDAFDELNPHNDPFATPFPVSNNKLTNAHDLQTPSVSVTPSQSTLLPKFSQKHTCEVQPSHTPILNTSNSQTSEQPAPDDFFHIRKRNSSGRIGVDLTSKSTARLWKTRDKKITPEEFEAVVQSKLSFSRQFQSVSSPVEPTAVSPITTQPDPPVVENSGVPAESTANLKNPEVVKDTGFPESKLIKPKSISRFSKSSFSSTSTRTGGHTAKILRVKKQSPKVDDKIKEVELERRKSSGSLVSIGGGLIDTLMTYGEKIRNSLGLSSNTPPDPEEPTQSGIIREPPMDNAPLSPKSPSKMETDLGPSPLNKNTINSIQEHVEETVMSVDQPPPVRTSKKRLLPLSPGRERKRKCLQDENANAYRSKRIPPYDGDDDKKKALLVNKGQKENMLKGIISRPKPLRASRSINKAFVPGAHNKTKSLDTDFGTGRSAPVGLSLRGASAVTSKSLNNSIPGTNSQPLFASDVYQQLALEKAQRESKVQFAKPVPPARPTLRPTIPAAFVFRSEERIATRHAEADENPKAEAVKRDGHSTLPVSSKPEGELSRKKQPNSILSADAPVLNTMIRAKAREKFDNERKEREKILELQRLIREKERAEREERDYKESRKRTVPRAHEVPEWYKEAPHKQKYVE